MRLIYGCEMPRRSASAETERFSDALNVSSLFMDDICHIGNTDASPFYAIMAIAQKRGEADNASMATRNKIKSLRKALDITSEELAERIGVSQTFMSRLESGERRLSEVYIFDLARELRCTPNDIFGFSEPKAALDLDAMRFSINLALEVVGEIPGIDPAEYVADAAFYVYDLVIRDGLLKEKEPRRSIRAAKALEEHLDLEQAARNGAK